VDFNSISQCIPLEKNLCFIIFDQCYYMIFNVQTLAILKSIKVGSELLHAKSFNDSYISYLNPTTQSLHFISIFPKTERFIQVIPLRMHQAFSAAKPDEKDYICNNDFHYLNFPQIDCIIAFTNMQSLLVPRK
jgi:hypothetical protein